MEKILFIIAVFLITSCVAILKAKDFKETWKFSIKWVFGLFALFALNLFNEAFLFEWLGWNGTNKNDWVFVLWWGLVFSWFIYGFGMLFRKLHEKE